MHAVDALRTVSTALCYMLSYYISLRLCDIVFLFYYLFCDDPVRVCEAAVQRGSHTLTAACRYSAGGRPSTGKAGA